MSNGNKLEPPPVGKHVRHTSRYTDGTTVVIDGPVTEHGRRGIVIGESALYCALESGDRYTVELHLIDDTIPTPAAAQPAGQWMIVEQLGHRRLAGLLQEVTFAGAGMLRLDIPAAGDDPGRTTYLAPSSIYALHPVGEATARAAAATFRPEPVSPWELAAIAGQPNPPVDAVPVDHDYDTTGAWG